MKSLFKIIWKFLGLMFAAGIISVMVHTFGVQNEDIVMASGPIAIIIFYIITFLVNKDDEKRHAKKVEEYNNYVKDYNINVETIIIPALEEKGFKIVEEILDTNEEFIIKLAVIDTDYDKYKVLIYNIEDDSLYDATYDNQTNIASKLDTVNSNLNKIDNSINAPRISVGVLF